MLLTTAHPARSGWFREIVIRSRQPNQRGTRGGTEPGERFTPSPSSGEASLAESFWCGWASGGRALAGCGKTGTLLFPHWWSFPRAYVRRGWSFPRSQPGRNRRLSASRTSTRIIWRGFARRRNWKSRHKRQACLRTYILRFRYWPFRAVALSWTQCQTSRALSNIALRTRACFIPSPLTRRMQLSRTSITASKDQPERLDYLHARTPAITISRFSTISLASLPGESVFTNWSRSWTQPRT